MNTRHLIAGAICAAALTTPALAADEATANLGVAAVVADTCILAAGTPLGFATINTQEASSQVTPGLVTVTCTASRGAITVTLDGGNNVSSGVRRMTSSGGDFLPYSVYKDSGHSESVAVNGAVYTGPVTAAVPRPILVYGQIPSGSYNAGAYSDTLLVTLSY
ncbi:MAG: spore coat U domain-containing protein [Roseovarius sp.]